MPDMTEDDVRRLAQLARLELTEDEIAAFVTQLGEILAFARTIQSVGSAGGDTVRPPSSSAGREDTAQPSLPRDMAISGAADADPATGLFKVPRVLGG